MTQNIAPQMLSPIMGTDGSSRVSGRRWLVAGVLAILAVLLAAGWLLPVVLQGRNQFAKIRETRSQNARSIGEFLSRSAGDMGLSEVSGEVTVLYATPNFFQITGKAEQADQYLPEQYLIFFISEDIHIGDLPLSPPQARLRMDGGREYLSAEGTQVLIDSAHHRTSTVRFPVVDAQGRNILADAISLDLILSVSEPAQATAATQWDLPIEYPANLLGGQTLTLGTVLALVAGLLAALSPCLTQLTACYLTTLASVGVRQAEESPIVVRGRVLRTALLFVAGFTLVYTAAGALAGLAGQAIQSSRLLVTWSGPLGVAAGALLIVMGLWVAINARAPLVCRLPMPTFMRLSRSGGVFGPVILGFAFAVGCAACFSGALFAALLLYLGTAATALQGATILFIFSLGIAVPYLLAAATLSQALPLLDRLEKVTPLVGLASGLVIIGFGLLMLTGNFHAVSDEVYGWLKWMSLLG